MKTKVQLDPARWSGVRATRFNKPFFLLAAFISLLFISPTNALSQCITVNDVYLTEVSSDDGPPCTKTVKININYTRKSAGQSSFEVRYRIGDAGPYTSLKCINTGNDGAQHDVPHLHTTSETINYNCSDDLYIQLAPWTNGTCGGSLCGDVVTFDPGALPVKFSALQAQKIHDQSIKIQWQSQQEQGVKNYSIEASKNGIHWTNIGTVDPKIAGGSSNEPVNYEFTVDLGGIAFAAISLAFLFIPLLGGRSRLKKQLLTATMLLILAACVKSDSAPPADESGSIWIRVVQHDINGGTTISKIVKVAQ